MKRGTRAGYVPIAGERSASSSEIFPSIHLNYAQKDYTFGQFFSFFYIHSDLEQKLFFYIYVLLAKILPDNPFNDTD